MISLSIFRLGRRRRRLRHFSKHLEDNFHQRLGTLLTILAGLICLHSVAMVVFEGMSWGDALWLSLTSATTVGYGDLSAATWQGRLATSILLYAIGISVLAQAAAEFVEFRIFRKEQKLKGTWEWKHMKDHILIINTPQEQTELYLSRLVEQFRKTPGFEDIPIQMLTTQFAHGLPTELVKYGVVHYNGVAQSTENLQAVHASQAKYIYIVTSDTSDSRSDSLTMDILDRLQTMQTKASILCEALDDNNRARFKRFGAHAVIRPVRAYPELAVRTFHSPGTEEVLENLFSHDGDHFHRHEVEFKDYKWADLACKLIQQGCGVPLGYVGEDGVVTNPLHDEVVSGHAIITILDDRQDVDAVKIARCLAA